MVGRNDYGYYQRARYYEPRYYYRPVRLRTGSGLLSEPCLSDRLRVWRRKRLRPLPLKNVHKLFRMSHLWRTLARALLTDAIPP